MGIAAIEEMVTQQEGVDWVIVELTGIADPGTSTPACLTEEEAPIAKTFWANEEMGDLLLDGVICIIDCKNFLIVRYINASLADGAAIGRTGKHV